MLDVVTSILEALAVLAALAAVAVAVAILGSPWGWPLALATVSAASWAASTVTHRRVEAADR